MVVVCLITLALVSLTAIAAVLYTLREVMRSHRDLMHRLMAADAQEYAALTQMDRQRPRKAAKVVRSEPPSYVPEPPMVDIVAAQEALGGL